MSPEISYIVSCFHRTPLLRTLLASLAAQTHQDFEAIVTDNTLERCVVEENRKAVKMFGSRFRYLHTGPRVKVPDCYWSAEIGMKAAKGRFLCFPCEDCYYPPEWADRMLTAGHGKDLILCEHYYSGPDTNGLDRYLRGNLGTIARPGYKPSFLVRREKFAGWINKPTVQACSGVDLTTLQHLVRRSDIRWAVARDLYYVHN